METQATHQPSSSAAAAGGPSVPWWRDPAPWLICLCATAIHAARLEQLTLRGEETRRALVAREMLASGDWILPTQQGQPFLSRPPLGSWLMAAAALVRGELDILAIRLPTVLATLATTILVYFYARLFLQRFGAIAAALAYTTMIEVMHLGRLAESEAVFTLWLAAALLAWHGGRTRGWSAASTWSVGYGLAALATLTKGPQGVIFFVLATGAYLAWRRELAAFRGRGHWIGVLVFALVYGAWQLPFLGRVGIEGMRGYLTFEMSQRFADRSAPALARHLAVFPLQLFAALLPWSVLLLGFLSKTIRARLGVAREPAVFLALAVAATFPTVWLPPGGRTRYLMPLFPLVAVLCGIVAQAFAEGASPRAWSRYRRVLLGMAYASAALGVGICLTSLLGADPLPPLLLQPPRMAAAFAVAAAFVAGVFVCSRHLPRPASIATTGFGLAILLGMGHTVLFINAWDAVSERIEPAIADVQSKLPAGEQLVSFGVLHHKFALFYPDPIPVVPWPAAPGESTGAPRYFCFHKNDSEPIQLPFDWELLAVVSCDRNRRPSPHDRVIVGRKRGSSETPLATRPENHSAR